MRSARPPIIDLPPCRSNGLRPILHAASLRIVSILNFSLRERFSGLAAPSRQTRRPASPGSPCNVRVLAPTMRLHDAHNSLARPCAAVRWISLAIEGHREGQRQRIAIHPLRLCKEISASDNNSPDERRSIEIAPSARIATATRKAIVGDKVSCLNSWMQDLNYVLSQIFHGLAVRRVAGAVEGARGAGRRLVRELIYTARAFVIAVAPRQIPL